MNEIERFLDHACCGVGGPPELRRHLREELREHLTEEIERNLAAGLSQEEAVHKAIEEFGDPVMIREGLQAVHGRRLMTLLIEKSMAWRETTMKMGWKWSFVAQTALALTLVAEVYFVAAAVVYVLPGVFRWHHDLGTPTVVGLPTIEWLAHAMYMDWLWIPCLLPVLAGWGLFEWKCRGENKSVLRLAGLSMVSLAMFLVLAAVCVPMVVDLAILPQQIHDLQVNLSPQQAERIVVPRIADGDDAFGDLRAAIEREDWPAADLAAQQLSDVYSSLADASAGAILLAGETRRGNLEEIRCRIGEIAESSERIHHQFRVFERSGSKAAEELKARIRTRFKGLDESRSKLAGSSDLFAAHETPMVPETPSL
ncbi:MAG: permease prefix domain 1-containing protein [Phycisphaerales bacterium]